MATKNVYKAKSIKHFDIDFEMLFLYTSYCRSMRAEQGRLAQLGEHLPYKQGVVGSIPTVPTKIEVGSEN